MHVVIAAAGKTGSAVVTELLAAGESIRGIVRKEAQAAALRAQGVEAAVADLADVVAITRAFTDAKTVYLLNPPAYSEADLFATAARTHATLIGAAEAAAVGRIVALSSVGAQHAAGTGNILTTHDLETRLAATPLPVTILRAANFIDNWAWVLPAALERGVLPSMLLPLDRRIPSVASEDIGRTAAALMREGGDYRRLVELHGAADYSPDDAAAALTEALGRPVKAVAVPETEWVDTFRRQGMPEVAARGFAEMYKGFNSGLIAFEGGHETRSGAITLQAAISKMIASRNQEQKR